MSALDSLFSYLTSTDTITRFQWGIPKSHDLRLPNRTIATWRSWPYTHVDGKVDHLRYCCMFNVLFKKNLKDTCRTEDRRRCRLTRKCCSLVREIYVTENVGAFTVDLADLQGVKDLCASGWFARTHDFANWNITKHIHFLLTKSSRLDQVVILTIQWICTLESCPYFEMQDLMHESQTRNI